MARNVKRTKTSGHKNRDNSRKRMKRIMENHELLKELKLELK